MSNLKGVNYIKFLFLLFLMIISCNSHEKKIDEEAAVKSCSWGRFQIMGEYYTKDSSYHDYKQFEEAMNMCELQHFSYFKTFIKKVKGEQLVDAMKKRDWHKIAILYNGKNKRVMIKK